MEQFKTEEKDLVRDKTSGAIIDVNVRKMKAAKEAKIRRLAVAEEHRQMKNDVDQLKNDMAELKTILAKIAEKL